MTQGRRRPGTSSMCPAVCVSAGGGLDPWGLSTAVDKAVDVVTAVSFMHRLGKTLWTTCRSGCGRRSRPVALRAVRSPPEGRSAPAHRHDEAAHEQGEADAEVPDADGLDGVLVGRDVVDDDP